jgi:hypothetical protein
MYVQAQIQNIPEDPPHSCAAKNWTRNVYENRGELAAAADASKQRQ